jgi:hypothetical protein
MVTFANAEELSPKPRSKLTPSASPPPEASIIDEEEDVDAAYDHFMQLSLSDASGSASPRRSSNSPRGASRNTSGNDLAELALKYGQ